MTARGFGPVALGILIGLVSLLVLTQLSQRADRTYDEATAIRVEGRRVLTLYDRTTPTSVLGSGWTAPVRGEGSWSTAPEAHLNPPTSSFDGEVLVSLTLASPPRQQPVTVRLGDAVLGAWTPSSHREETVTFVAPRSLRAHSYDLQLVLEAGDAPLRIVKVVTKVR
ncbi:hypothetical protein B7G68_04675 [Caulobacter segnis]|uniref:Uncharacterized protein n=2 Tax=Caulobacter segnis TaxID=88688 RepID=D5VEZ9_CAUST|nr:hypothetical protein Cseg_0911 [Caulobacter segnis ATCC 21756]AVQ01216.1 hypothetical protein B7G68_04675 [Caulobacter segnis]